MKNNSAAGLMILSLCAGCAMQSAAPQGNSATARKFSGATPLEWSQRLADSEIARRGDSLAWRPGGKARWDYAAGLFTLSLLKLNEQAPAPRCVEFSKAAIGSFISDAGSIQTYNRNEFQLDALNPGRTALALWRLTGEPRYKKAAMILRFQLISQPRTDDGGFWHKQRYTNQMWLDGLYMAAPFYAEYGKSFDEPGVFADVARQIRLLDEHTYDAKTGLNYHGWDAAKIQLWANPATGCSSNFWGRAEGWYAMALVDVLDFFPADHPARKQIIATLQKTARGIAKWQDAKTGLWWQVMDQGGRKGNYLEATASAMFVYALAKGVHHSYLPRDYIPVIEKGYGGIVANLIQSDDAGQWSLTQCCLVAGLGGSPANGNLRDGSFDYYISEPVVKDDLKGVGPFILAGIEMRRLMDFTADKGVEIRPAPAIRFRCSRG
jgi:unsaturated rhamnogalacturonyl hydrolase